MELNLGGKSVVVTGGGSNIGRGISLAFAREGVHLTLAEIDEGQGQKVVDEARRRGAASATLAPTDVTKWESVQAMVKEVEVWSVRVAGWSTRAAAELGALAEVIAVPDRAFDGAALLISMPEGRSIDAAIDALVKSGASMRCSTLVGSHASRYRVSAGTPVPGSSSSGA